MKFLLIVLAIGLAAAAPADSIKPLADDCSFTLTDDVGTFKSLNFPENYGSNSNCSWLIITDGGTDITLRFDSFLTEPNVDVVQVYDGPTTASRPIGNFSGFVIPPTVYSSSNVMLVVFTSNNALNYAGFQANYTSSLITTRPPITTTTVADDCGGIEVGSGIIESPYHPANYPNKANCLWYLRGNSASAIVLEFQAFVTENKVDYVSVWEGWNPAETEPVRIYTGDLQANVPFSYATSKTNLLTVKFISDEDVSASGFRAFFS